MNNSELYQPIDTQRTRLRCPTANDAPAIAKLATPDVSRWLAAWPAPMTDAMATARIIQARREIIDGSALHFLIERREDRNTMGWIRLSHSDTQSGLGDLGYWLNAAYQHCGYAAEAVIEAMAMGFETLNLDSIEGGAQPENTASLALMRKLGMEACGERMVWAEARRRDELCLYYSITREKFTANSLKINLRTQQCKSPC